MKYDIEVEYEIPLNNKLLSIYLLRGSRKWINFMKCYIGIFGDERNYIA